MATDNARKGGAAATKSSEKDRTYSYCRDRDGVFDVFIICNPRGVKIAKLHFWDEPDTNEGHLAEMSAQSIVANLNRWYFDGFVEFTVDRRGRKRIKFGRWKKR